MNGPLWKILFARGYWRKSVYPAPQWGAIRSTSCQKLTDCTWLCSEHRGGVRQTGDSLHGSAFMNCDEGAFANFASAFCFVSGRMFFGNDVQKLQVGLLLVIWRSAQTSTWWCLYANTGLAPLWAGWFITYALKGSKEQIKQRSCWILIKIIVFSI